MRRRLEKIFAPESGRAYQQAHALPKIDEIRLNGPRVCLVLSPDSKLPPTEAQDFWKSVTEKNNFCIVTGDGSNLASLEEKTRRIWAIARVLEETGGDKSPSKSELEEEAESAEHDFNSTVSGLFNRVYYPAKGGLIGAKLSMTFAGNQFKGEEQVEKSLSDIGVSKLYKDVEANADALLLRAEEMLWPPGGDRRIPWRDVLSRSLSNERWPWLPPKGLDELRRIAVGTGRWRYSDAEGYVERGPFPKEKTSVIVSERDYNEETGAATLEITPHHAGPHGRVYFAKDANVSAESQQVPDSIYSTDETVLWFLAVDPDGVYETGDPYKWTNHLTLTHERQVLPGGERRVQLTVKPRGTIRWNIDATNRKEGKLYSAPIELTTDAEVVVYAYAEDQGVAIERDFRIPKADQKGPAIDKTKSAKLNKKTEFGGTTAVYGAISNLQSVHARLYGVSLTVGEGLKTAGVRFGSGVSVKCEVVHEFIQLAKNALADERAHVVMKIEALEFNSGHDLEAFAAKENLNIESGDVQQ